jgi:hypothetical protein
MYPNNHFSDETVSKNLNTVLSLKNTEGKLRDFYRIGKILGTGISVLLCKTL